MLEYLRKANNKGEIVNWVKKRHKREAEEGMDLATFARKVKPRGEKMISADMVSRLNDKYFGQWLALHVPFRNIDELGDKVVKEKVPSRFYYFTCALQLRPDYWKNPEKIEAAMKLEAHGDEHIANVLNMVKTQSFLVEEYLSGRISKNEEKEDMEMREEATGKVAENIKEVSFDPQQQRLKSHIDQRVDQALEARRVDDPDKAELARDRALEHGRPLIGLGGPGTGKTTVAEASIRRAKELGAHILITVPTGQMTSKMRERFPDLDVDTCHGAFLFHKPENEALPLMSQYDLVVVDELSQLSQLQFERIIRMWHAADKIPALVFLGDFYQLPGIDSTNAMDSPAYKVTDKIVICNTIHYVKANCTTALFKVFLPKVIQNRNLKYAFIPVMKSKVILVGAEIQKRSAHVNSDLYFFFRDSSSKGCSNT